MSPCAGVLAVQGDFEAHLAAVKAAGAQAVREVRTVEDLALVDRLIIPGGESTTVGKLLQRFGLGEEIVARAAAGMPVWGTCMGMILMARAVVGHDQPTLALLDIDVERNAFGAQVHSFEVELELVGLDGPLLGVFIRAPVVTRCGPGVSILARCQDQIVAVRQGRMLGTAFHPELTRDRRLHALFLSL